MVGSSSPRWFAAALAAIVIVTFWKTPGNQFILLDDPDTVARNPDFAPPTPSHWRHYWTGPTFHLYMPITYMFWGGISYAAEVPGADGAGSTLDPAAFHWASIVLHAANAMLVFALLRKLVSAEWPAFFGALLFAVHPVQVEAVAWVTAASIPLSTFFSLCALWEFLVFSDLRLSAPALAPKSRAWLHYALGTLCLAMALLSKPAAIVVPLLALAIEMIFRGRRLRDVLGPLAPWVAMCIPIAIVTYWVQQSNSITVPIWQRPFVAADALAFYIYKLLLPIALMPIYGRTPSWLFGHRSVVALTWIVPAIVTLACIALWRRQRWVVGSALLFIIPLAPVLGLTVFVYQHISTPADRYLYLAMLGPALLVAWMLPRKPGVATFAGAGIIGLMLAGLSYHQTQYWSDTLTLFTRVVEFHPESGAAHEVLGNEYNTEAHDALAQHDIHGARRKLQLAADEFSSASSLPYDNGVGSFNAGECLSHLIDRQRDAIACYQAAVADPRFPGQALAYDAMGLCYARLHDRDHAAECFTQALRLSDRVELAPVHKMAQEHLVRFSPHPLAGTRLEAANPDKSP